MTPLLVEAVCKIIKGKGGINYTAEEGGSREKKRMDLFIVDQGFLLKA